MQTDGWFFVIGPARTGTTLVAHLLNLHPDCTCLNDTGIVQCFDEAISPPNGRDTVARVRWTNPEDISSGAAEEIHYTGWPLPQLTRGTQAITADDFVRAACDGLRGLYPRTKWFGDKWPGYVANWQRVLVCFPDAVIIRTERDVDATVESLLRTAWAYPGLDVSERRRLVEKTVRYQRDCAVKCPANCVVDLEQLNAEPRVGIQHLLDALPLSAHEYPWTEALVQFEDGRRLS